MNYSVYILKCSDDSLYTGCTNDLKRRIKQHNASKLGAHYTKLRRPVVLIHSETFKTLKEARRRETEIKKWSRAKKMGLVKNNKLSSKIIIRPQTVDEEFDYLMGRLRKMAFYNEQGYKISIPEHPFFINLSNNLDLLESLSMKEARNIFKKEVYDIDYFKNGLKVINKEVELIEKAIERMKRWKSWGFKLFPKYEVRLTAYGPGGSYNFNNGNIILKAKLNGVFGRPPLHSLVHEIIHIGIEKCIIEKYELSHVEKEGLVDGLCLNYFDDILVDYTVQSRGDKEVFKLISKNNTMKLLQIIAEYKEK